MAHAASPEAVVTQIRRRLLTVTLSGVRWFLSVALWEVAGTPETRGLSPRSTSAPPTVAWGCGAVSASTGTGTPWRRGFLLHRPGLEPSSGCVFTAGGGGQS